MALSVRSFRDTAHRRGEGQQFRGCQAGQEFKLLEESEPDLYIPGHRPGRRPAFWLTSVH